MDFITQLFNNMNLMGGGIALLVSIPFLIVGLVFLFIVVRAGGKVRESKNRPSTSGRVLASDIEMRRSRSSRGGTTTAYYPVVLYEYMVNGRRLQSNRVCLWQRCWLWLDEPRAKSRRSVPARRDGRSLL